MRYFCCNERRREAVKSSPSPNLNGIDFLEVVDRDAQTPDQRQRILRVAFLNKPAPPNLTPDNLAIIGGERIADVKADAVSYDGNILVVHVNAPGDFSTYTLRLVKAGGSGEPLDGLDPFLSSIDFSFKVECPSDFDCLAKRICPPEPQLQPEINYLAKDYASFRQLMLDRMALLMSQWKERNPADTGIILVELLAYAGDYLSYQQDAIATEAYLGTARKRISVRRHARLVDYFMHEGCNARALVHIHVNADMMLHKGTQLLTQIDGQPVCIPFGSLLYEQALARKPEVFETMHTAMLFQAHSELNFYTWGARECCLPKGATRATLHGHFPDLKAGDLLIFTEVRDPQTGNIDDANPAHRHAVRLIHVMLSQDELGGKFLDNPNNNPVDVTEIQWAPEDALPFPLCISATTDREHGEKYRDNVSIALGNIVLADHGLTIKDEPLGEVPKPALFSVPPQAGDRCQGREIQQVPPRFSPHLKEIPLTFTVPFDKTPVFGIDFDPQYETDLDGKNFSVKLQQQFVNQRIVFKNTLSIQGSRGEWSLSDGVLAYIVRKEDGKLNVYDLPESANKVMRYIPQDALPAITSMRSDLNSKTANWIPQRDLLNSKKDATHFVVEIESDGTAYLRFGNYDPQNDNSNISSNSSSASHISQAHGLRPDSGTKFTATYRTGNGMSGNVGAEAIAHIICDSQNINNCNNQTIDKVYNPFTARGGVEPESIETVRQSAPSAFRIQKRAVTQDDYAEVAQRHPEVQRAAATFRWTGSWRTVFVTIDRLGGLPVDDNFKKDMREYLERYRMAGYDVEIDGPGLVSLEIDMLVCVKPDYFRSDVESALLQVFSNRILPDGRKGVFHPDNFTFGQPVYLSPLYAAAQAVEGVSFVQIMKFQRQGTPGDEALKAGKLILGRLEIARLDNDPNFPEHGVLRLVMEGGK